MAKYDPFDVPQPEGEYVYHYTNADSLQLILGRGTLRFNSLSLMNDPRESKAWVPRFTYTAPDSIDDAEREHLRSRWDAMLRGGIRIGCFVSDVDVPDRAGRLGQGWARPRLWHNYGGKHSGACLVLEKSALVAAAERQARPHEVVAQDVEYEDSPLEIQVPLTVARDAKAQLAAAALRRDAIGPLCFRKHQDWSSEREFRVAVLADESDPPFDLAFGAALRYVVVGEGYTRNREDLIRLVEAIDVPRPQRCFWQATMPTLVSF